MDQRLSFVTLVVADLAATRRFYLDGLGWVPALEASGEVLMFRVGEHVVLSLWDEAEATQEIGPVTRGGTPPVTLAHNVATTAEVDEVLDDARRAGAPKVHDAVRRDWGGYSGYFADPDGFRWEVAYNPGEIGASVLP
ncbi:VOC family protein [Isoptericola cucumis]|uniref:Glyoxalase n=1 Tax=Isoptericola cucumis TaxID=1776856 RepID=A0ABQ2B4W3_9MICO|nr:VOC family protein [Isoptericola cucumis]GGI06195.1 glyoxalase [Isoptericola cucumis]